MLNQQIITRTARAIFILYNSAEQSGNRLMGDHYALYALHTRWVARTSYECIPEPLVQAFFKRLGISLKMRLLQEP